MFSYLWAWQLHCGSRSAETAAAEWLEARSAESAWAAQQE